MEGSTGGWRCPSCGKEGNTGKFCIRCGKPHAPLIWTCQVCGRCDNTGEFCVGCGTRKVNSTGTEISGQPQKIADPGVAPDVSLTGQQQINVQSDGNANSKSLFVAVGIAILCAAGYFGYGYYIEQRYDAKCEEVLASATEMGQSVKGIGGLSGDAESDETKNIVQQIDDEIQRMEAAREALNKAEAPDDKKTQKKNILAFIETNKDVLEKANQVLKNKDFVIDRKSGEKLDSMYDEFKNAMEAVNQLEDVNIKGTDMKEISQIDQLPHNLQSYVEKKLARDHTAYREKMKFYQQRLENDNETLKQKNELVFLPQEVVVSGHDLLVRGMFYNGTSDRITGFKGMSVDLTLRNLEDEVLSIQNYEWTDTKLSRMFIPPKTIAPWKYTIRLPGKADGIGTYNNFQFHAHDIHWVAARI